MLKTMTEDGRPLPSPPSTTVERNARRYEELRGQLHDTVLQQLVVIGFLLDESTVDTKAVAKCATDARESLQDIMSRMKAVA